MKARPWASGISLLLTLLIGFCWGVAVHRHKVFPYSLLRGIAARAGFVNPRPGKHIKPAADETSPALEALRSLPYVGGTFDPHASQSGVLLYKPEKASPGLTLYGSFDVPRAQLIDLHGNTVFSWSGSERKGWQHFELLDDGGLLVIAKDRELFRIDHRSRRRWTVRGRFHHDLWVSDDRIWALSRQEVEIPEVHPALPILTDLLVEIDLETGRVQETIDLVDVFLGSKYRFLVPVVSHRRDAEAAAEGDRPSIDLLHTNHVEVLDGSLEPYSSILKRGNFLLSMRSMNTIAVVDGSTLEVVWAWGPGTLTRQHHPTLLDSGRILVFDNGSGQSSLLEVNPSTFEIAWHYTDPDFFSKTRGSAQRLPNGNTLITESDTGYVFEVTATGEKVWEFANPLLLDGDKRAAIWRATRFPRSEFRFLR